MLRLNNKLLTIEGIIDSFNVDVVNKSEPGKSSPPLLVQYKTKLKQIYFNDLEKNASDEVIFAALQQDTRFTPDHPELKAALDALFKPDASPDKAVLLQTLNESLLLKQNTESLARSQWEKFNTELGYFESTPDLFPLFYALSNASRTMIDLIEQNRADATMPYTYAYHMMALFVDQTNPTIPDFASIAKQTEALLKKAVSGTTTPYHDVLLNKVSLPVARDIHDMPGWRTFLAQNLKNNIVPALRYFAMAPAIEKQMDKLAPKTLAEAKSMAARCYYARGAENPELATLCRDNNIPEQGNKCSFNKCLDYLNSVSWPVKQNDLLPSIEIKGEGEAAGYYWVKLPTNDLRALILGQLTASCQNIGGYSELCVKDAVSLPENGLYVLLKLKSGKSPDSAPFTNDKSIHYDAFEIVGQSYGWISTRGNITLDSLECSSGRVPLTVSQSMLTRFATRVLEDNPAIKYVTLGAGGGTPRDIGFERAFIPEVIRTGYGYPDARMQYIISAQVMNKEYTHTLQEVLNGKPREFCQCIEYLSQYTEDQPVFIEQLRTLLKDFPSIVNDLTKTGLTRLFIGGHYPCLDDLKPVDFNTIEHMAPEDRDNISIARLIWRAQTTDAVLAILPYVRDHDRLAVVKEKNAEGQAVLHAAASNPALLKVILELLPKSQRLDAVRDKDSFNFGKTVLHAAAKNPALLKAILELLPENQRLAAVMEKNEDGQTVLDAAANNHHSLKTILELLPESQRLDAVMAKNSLGETLLHATVHYYHSLKTILQLLPESQRLDAVMEKNRVGYALLTRIADNNELFRLVLELLPESQRLVALMQKNANGRTVLHDHAEDARSIKTILEALPEGQRLAAVMEKDDEYGTTALHYAVSVPYPEPLQAILELLPQSERLDAMMVKTIDGYTALDCAAEAPPLLEAMLASLSMSQLLMAIQHTENESDLQKALHAKIHAQFKKDISNLRTPPVEDTIENKTTLPKPGL